MNLQAEVNHAQHLMTSDCTFLLIYCKFTANKHSGFNYPLTGTGFTWHKGVHAKFCFHKRYTKPYSRQEVILELDFAEASMELETS